jgi:hypothetical protein
MKLRSEGLKMADETIGEKAGFAVGFGIAAAEDAVGAIKSAFDSAVAAVMGSSKKTAEKAVKKASAKKAIAKKAAKKAVVKEAVKKAPAKKSPAKKAAKKSVKTRAKKGARFRS